MPPGPRQAVPPTWGVRCAATSGGAAMGNTTPVMMEPQSQEHSRAFTEPVVPSWTVTQEHPSRRRRQEEAWGEASPLSPLSPVSPASLSGLAKPTSPGEAWSRHRGPSAVGAGSDTIAARRRHREREGALAGQAVLGGIVGEVLTKWGDENLESVSRENSPVGEARSGSAGLGRHRRQGSERASDYSRGSLEPPLDESSFTPSPVLARIEAFRRELLEGAAASGPGSPSFPRSST